MTGSGEKIEIVEVGVRDGLQNDPSMMSTEAKLEFVGRLIDAGVRRLEAASFVNPKRVPQMADSDAVMARVPRNRGVRYIGLALNVRGARQAVDAGCDEINFSVSATDSFGKRNQNATTEEALNRFSQIREIAHQANIPCSATISTVFGCPFEGEVPIPRITWVVSELAARGADEIALADTIGVATPWDVKTRIAAARDVSGPARLRAHFHNTRNTGIAGACAAIDAGITVLDASCGGIGGCPFAPKATGNIATEDLVFTLHRAGFDTGINLERLIETANWLETALDHPVPSLVSKAGGFPAQPPA